MLRVLIAGGGTGGHVIPALAIARELRDAHAAEVRFVGTARGLETRLVPDAGFALELIHVGQLKNVSIATRLRTLFDLPLGVARCVGSLRQFQPDVVVGVGGYASGPAMMAAILLRIPTLAFEPNAFPGLANRLVGKHVSAAAVNFEETKKYFRNAHVTGIPVRPEFFSIEPLPRREIVRESLRYIPENNPSPGSRKLLVFGGSQGARLFNEAIPQLARQLLDSVPGLTILHQSGLRNFEETLAAYRENRVDQSRVTVAAFLEDMPRRFAEAQLIVCRSGASTLAELAAAGRPSVLVPFPGAADNHQEINARVFADRGAAVMLTEDPPDQQMLHLRLFDELSGLLYNPDHCAAMGEQARSLARPDAILQIAALCTRLVRSK